MEAVTKGYYHAIMRILNGSESERIFSFNLHSHALSIVPACLR
jgi:hypothetical protein